MLKPSTITIALPLILLAAACASPEKPVTDEMKLERIESMYAEYRKDFPGVREITARNLIDWQTVENDELVIVDVRDPGERAISTLPGAISKDDFEENLDRYEDKEIVVYCTIGYRSGEYARDLAARGIDAYNLKGSVLGWAHEGALFIDPEGKPTKRVHVYGEKWNLLPEGYEAVW